MRVDIQSLSTYNRLAAEGAEAAAANLSGLTGVESYVEVSRIALASVGDVRAELADDVHCGVSIGIEGALDGQTLLTLDETSTATLTEDLLPGLLGGRPAEDGVREVANIMTSGFIDGWADFLGAAIEVTPPSHVDGDPLAAAETDLGDEDVVFVFESEMGVADAGTDLSFSIYMLPERRSLTRLLDASDGEATIPMANLAAFDDLIDRGAAGAADHLTSMTGIETEVEVSRLSFVPVEDTPGHVGNTVYAGVVLELDGTPDGYIAILFDEPSARRVVDALIPTDPPEEGDGFEGMSQSAIEEVGNVMTSGFVDGWANVLDGTIDISPPAFVHDMGDAIVDPLAARLGRTQEHAFIIDTLIMADGSEIGCEIYVLPSADDLREALTEL
ncbi:MAG: chemotaxis protein CheC, partial [Halobacteriaceae archaeon]